MKPVNYDAEFCGKVPLHQTNSVQPHGVLLVLEKESGGVLQASENADRIFGMPAKELVNKPLANMATAGDDDLSRLLRQDLSDKLPFELHANGEKYTALLQKQDDYLLLEIEVLPATKNDLGFIPLFREISRMQSAIDAAEMTEEACRIVVSELKGLSGFDKVMVYRFDEDWNGDVIAEAAEEGMSRYLGLRFPASDIPKQARELYKKTPYRLIPTIDYEAVKLYPVLNPQTNGFTNLSNANLRSVAGVHVEYLRNMNVNASMSTRILVNGQLWGLIACHHRTPMYLSYRLCTAFELLSGTFAAKITSLQTKDALLHQGVQQERLVRLVQSLQQRGDYKPLLCELLEADGVALVRNERTETAGATPPEESILDLVHWLSSGAGELRHEPALSAAYEPAEGYAKIASGLLALPLNGQNTDFVLAFRTEAVQKINWGGNPSEAVQFESDGTKYHPRASFRQWQQTVHNRALPWSADALNVARDVQKLLATFTHYL